ncbi:MAG TPA: hypothetical protein PLQ28_06615 [Flexilinea sp.]|nr:hypothetical protein [Flexilinea sp.]HOW07486.1 hypothetical protein [Flexilinea sp.]
MTLFISDIEPGKRNMRKISLFYLLNAIFCALFGIIYEQFSHGVYSGYMIFAFAFPLVGGTFPFAVLSLFAHGLLPGRLPRFLYNAGIAALTVGSMMKGVLEIYGTTNDLLKIYRFAGFGFVGIGLIIYAAELLSARKSHHEKNDSNENQP